MPNDSNSSTLGSVILVAAGVVLLLISGVPFFVDLPVAKAEWSPLAGGQHVDETLTIYIACGVGGIASILGGLIQLRRR